MEEFVGEIKMFGGDYPPENWLICDGQGVLVNRYIPLYSIIGNIYGGNDYSFCLPDLRSVVPIGAGRGQNLNNRFTGEKGGTEIVRLNPENVSGHNHSTEVTSPEYAGIVSPLASTENDSLSPVNAFPGKTPGDFYCEEHSTGMGESTAELTLERPAIVDVQPAGSYSPDPHNNIMPFQAVNYIICYASDNYPEREKPMPGFLGDIRMTGGSYTPENWMFCQGQTLNISDFPDLYNIVGTLYGGDGQTTFRLPDLQGRVPLGSGSNRGYPQGYSGGSEKELLTGEQLPQHTHEAKISPPELKGTVSLRAAVEPESKYPKGQYPCEIGNASFATTSNTTMGSSEVEIYKTSPMSAQLVPAGGAAPHENMQPFLVVNFMICVKGSTPIRS